MTTVDEAFEAWMERIGYEVVGPLTAFAAGWRAAHEKLGADPEMEPEGDP